MELTPLHHVSLIIVVMACWVSFRNQPTRFTPNDTGFKDRYGDWAIVAGGSEGIGAAWAETLCELNLNVLLIARRTEGLKTLKQELESKYKNAEVDTLELDLASSDLEQVFKGVINNKERKYGMLVYNAAHSKIGHFVDIPLEQQYTTLDVNVRSVLTLTHMFSNYLKDRGDSGGIILMSSLTGELGSSFISNYAATKAWNTVFAHGLRYELLPHNIDVLACVAGATTSPKYLETVGDTGRIPMLELTPNKVPYECVQAIGARSSIRTGYLNKLIRFVMVRIMPLETAVYLFNSGVEKTLPLIN